MQYDLRGVVRTARLACSVGMPARHGPRSAHLRGLNFADFDVVVDQTHGVQFSRRARSGDSGTVAPRRGASGEYWLTRETV